MKDFGKQRSTIQPEPLVVDEFSVWVHSNIVPVQKTIGEETFTGFEFNMVQYEKDEYIKGISEINDANASALDALLTDIIPSMMGGV